MFVTLSNIKVKQPNIKSIKNYIFFVDKNKIRSNYEISN